MQTQQNNVNDPLVNDPATDVPYMNTLTAVSNKVVKDGYTDSFNVTDKRLRSTATEQAFGPEDVNIINFYRFEGQSDPSDNAILYVIETATGLKGTLIDAYGAYSDSDVDSFMKEVEAIHKKPKTDK
jgi:hypothetical protein